MTRMKQALTLFATRVCSQSIVTKVYLPTNLPRAVRNAANSNGAAGLHNVAIIDVSVYVAADVTVWKSPLTAAAASAAGTVGTALICIRCSHADGVLRLILHRVEHLAERTRRE